MATHETITMEELLDLFVATRCPDDIIVTVDGLGTSLPQLCTAQKFSDTVQTLTGEPVDMVTDAPDAAVIRVPDQDTGRKLMKQFQDSSLYLRLYDRGRFICQV